MTKIPGKDHVSWFLLYNSVCVISSCGHSKAMCVYYTDVMSAVVKVSVILLTFLCAINSAHSCQQVIKWKFLVVIKFSCLRL